LCPLMAAIIFSEQLASASRRHIAACWSFAGSQQSCRRARAGGPSSRDHRAFGPFRAPARKQAAPLFEGGDVMFLPRDKASAFDLDALDAEGRIVGADAGLDRELHERSDNGEKIARCARRRGFGVDQRLHVLALDRGRLSDTNVHIPPAHHGGRCRAGPFGEGADNLMTAFSFVRGIGRFVEVHMNGLNTHSLLLPFAAAIVAVTLDPVASAGVKRFDVIVRSFGAISSVAFWCRVHRCHIQSVDREQG
jgi:hypothetical protein